MLLLGCDFSSAPTSRKPIVVATGALEGRDVVLATIEHFASLDDWSDWLQATPEWIGGFDLPFGLPRELVEQLGWPLQWEALMAHYASLTRAEIRLFFAAFCAARPVGGKFAHRATDGPAGSSPSMKWVNPPVAFMLHAGVSRLLAAGATFPGLQPAQVAAKRIALEAYPGLLARELIGRRSYKSDDLQKQTSERALARVDLLAALERGATRLGLALKLNETQRTRLLADARGDRIDAVLCLVQAAWAELRREETPVAFGLPAGLDPLEGWILTS
ncbi:MAG: hypothetical protein JWQ73_1603 [Variovorax sp.]|nr:hypothetical protein [Variovorax sp.]